VKSVDVHQRYSKNFKRLANIFLNTMYLLHDIDSFSLLLTIAFLKIIITIIIHKFLYRHNKVVTLEAVRNNAYQATLCNSSIACCSFTQLYSKAWQC